MTQSSTKNTHCRACDGSGKVPSADGSPRPCSRCDVDGFNAWCAARRKEAAQ